VKHGADGSGVDGIEAATAAAAAAKGRSARVASSQRQRTACLSHSMHVCHTCNVLTGAMELAAVCTSLMLPQAANRVSAFERVSMQQQLSMRVK